MSSTPDEFLDSNVLVCAFTSDPRAETAQKLLAGGCRISVQGLNEFANVARRKLGMSRVEVREAPAAIRTLCQAILPIDIGTHTDALWLAERMDTRFFDALVIAAALRADGGVLWSEDMQDGLVVDRRLRIANPFRQLLFPDPSERNSHASQVAAMKALLDQPGLRVMPGCGDGMGARLIEEAGFAVGFASGSSIAAMRLAMPDMDLLTFPEMADAVETVIAAAPGVLWLADSDTGYGNALAVQKTIRSYARRGAAAVLIEDKAWPRPLGHNGAKLVIERDAAIQRCRVAVEACREEGILLLARTDARISRGFDEALTRLKAFVTEGADILFLDSPQSEAELREAVAAGNGKPALAVSSPAGKHFMPGDVELERLGVKIVVYPQEILAATVHAVRAALAGLKGGAKPPMASPAELATAIRAADYLARDARWPDPR